MKDIQSALMQAIKLACDAHYGQFDKVGEPYILHPIAVLQQCNTCEEKIVAILHDILEDTEAVSEAELRCCFSQEIVDAVVAITKLPDEKYFDYIERCKLNYVARMVKLADLEHNLSEDRMAGLPIKEQLSLKKRYNKAIEILMYGD